MDNKFGGGFSSNQDNYGQQMESKDDLRNFFICQLHEAEKLMNSDDDEFKIDDVKINNPVILGRLTKDETDDNDARTLVFEDFTGSITVHLNNRFNAVSQTLKAMSLECDKFYRVQLGTKFYKEVIYNMINIREIKDVSEITAHLALIGIGYNTRLGVQLTYEESKTTQKNGFGGFGSSSKDEITSIKQAINGLTTSAIKFEHLVNRSLTHFPDRKQEIETAIKNMIQSGELCKNGEMIEKL